MQIMIDPLRHAVRTGADRIACVDGSARFSYADMMDRCRRLAGALDILGINAGDRVALLAANSHQYLECYIGIPSAGAVIVPLNTRHASAELEYALRDSGARVLISDRPKSELGGLVDLVEHALSLPEDYERLLGEAAPRQLGEGVDENTLAGLFYTGGTTGASKGVMLTHRNLIANTYHWMTVQTPSPGSVYLVVAPLFHAAGSNSVLSTCWAGGTQVVVPTFDPEQVLDLIEREKVTDTLLVPTMVAAVTDAQLARPRDVSSLRMLAHGGSPIATETVRRAAGAFANTELVHLYGATETGPLATALRDEQNLIDGPLARSCGMPIPGVEIEIRDVDGQAVADGEFGEVTIRGANIMRGYWNKRRETDDVLRNSWYATGDVGCFDSDGHLFLVDRKKDMIVTGGENVYSTEVEDVLYRHPDVLEAAVFAVPSEQWGEAVHAVVVPRNPVDEGALSRHCREFLAGYKVPKSITFQDEPLPKSGPGKILKRSLRAPFWADKDSSVA